MARTVGIGHQDFEVLRTNGYFYIDSSDKLHKVHDYVDGETFLAPNGKLYVYNSDTLQVINLTDHKKVKRLTD